MSGHPDIFATIKSYADAWAAGDLSRIVAAYHDDFVLHYPGTHGLSGTHRGKQASLSALAEFGKRTSRRFVRIVDVMAGASRGAIIARELFGKGDEQVEVDRVLVYRVEDGMLRECWLYDADQALIDRFVGP